MFLDYAFELIPMWPQLKILLILRFEIFSLPVLSLVVSVMFTLLHVIRCSSAPFLTQRFSSFPTNAHFIFFSLAWSQFQVHNETLIQYGGPRKLEALVTDWIVIFWKAELYQLPVLLTGGEGYTGSDRTGGEHDIREQSSPIRLARLFYGTQEASRREGGVRRRQREILWSLAAPWHREKRQIPSNR